MKNKSIRQDRFDARDKAAQLFCWCMVVAMHQEEGIGASRLEKACNKMEAFQARYKGTVIFGSRKTATDAMKADLEGICDFEVRLPKLKAPRNRREEQLYMAECDGAEIAWLVMASTVHLTFGFGEKRLSRLKQEAMKNYEQYLGWVVEGGEDWALNNLKRCVEDALQEELVVLDHSRDAPTYGQKTEAERYENIAAISQVSSNMAAERGVKRVPLAVLSQNEIARRMKAI